MDLTQLTISQIAAGLRKREFSVLELCQTFLDRIKKENPKINAIVTLNEHQALLEAKKIEDLFLQKRKLPELAGIPLVIKDNILAKGLRCTAGSKILENYLAPYDATVIKKLKTQGAIILGKTNLDEFAMGSSTERSIFGSTKNPLDLKRVAGGSSGGSAAAVAANFAPGALGSDTGGSIRQPAAFCGIVGLKPTYGAVSRFGLIAMASSLDQVGPMARKVKDCQLIFEAIFGKDPLDSTSVVSRPYYEKKEIFPSQIKIGLPKEYFGGRLQVEIKESIQKTIKKFEKVGFEFLEISLPHTDLAIPTYYLIMSSEISANLARYDGIKYGFSKKSRNLRELYFKTRGEGFGEEVKRRIMLGTFALSAGYYEAYYLRALKIRTKIKEDFEKAFKKVDLILTPVSPILPFKLGEKLKDPVTMYWCDIFTVSINLAGLPALALPIDKAGKFPVVIQLIAPAFEENKIFKIAEILENLC